MFFRLAKNSISLLIAGVVDKVAYAIFFAIIARRLSQSEFGTYNLFLTVLFLGGMIAEFGIGSVIIREIAKNRERSATFFNNALLMTTSLSLFTWPFMIGVSVLLHYPAEVISLLSFGGATFLFIGVRQIAAAVIKAYERMEIFILVASLHSIISVGFGIMVLWRGWGLTALVIVLMITEGLKAAFLIGIVHRYFARLAWQIDQAIIISLLKQAVPFALLMAYSYLLHRTDLLLMGWLRPIEEVATYSAAVKLADVLSLLSGSMIGALFPALSAKLTSSRQELWQVCKESIGVFAILGFGAASALMILAQPIIAFVFGATYITGATALCWLGWAFLFSVLGGPVGTLLLAAGDQMYRLLTVSLIVLGSNVVLDLWLIPLFSYNGAAIATFVSTVLGFMGRLLLSRLYFGQMPKLVGVVWRALLASVCMALLLKFLNGLHFFALIVIGGLAYGIILAALGEFREARYQPIRIKLSKILGTLM